MRPTTTYFVGLAGISPVRHGQHLSPLDGLRVPPWGLGATATIVAPAVGLVDVVNGFSQAEHTLVTTAVGLCLGIGFGIWWNYFDFVGLRSPRTGLGMRTIWLVTHLPQSMTVAAAGAGMVSLIGHHGT